MAHDSIRTHDTRCPCDRCMRIRVDLAQPPTWSNFRLLPDTGLHEDNISLISTPPHPDTWVQRLGQIDLAATWGAINASAFTANLDVIDDPTVSIFWPDPLVPWAVDPVGNGYYGRATDEAPDEPTWDDIGMGAIANQPYDGRQANTDDMRVERWSRVVDRPDAERFVANHNALEAQQKALRTLGYSGADLIAWETDVSQRLGATGYSFEPSWFGSVPQGREAFEALDEVQRFLLRTGARLLAGGILVPLPLPPRAFTTFERASDRPYLAASALPFTDPDAAALGQYRQYPQAQFGRDVTPGTAAPTTPSLVPRVWSTGLDYSSDAGTFWMLKVYTPAIIRPSAREWNVLRSNIGLSPLPEKETLDG